MTTKYNEMIGRMDAYNAALTKRDEMKAEAHRLTVRLAQLKHERSTLTYTMPHCSVAGCRTKLRGKGFMCHNHHLRAVKARGNREPLAGVKFIVKEPMTHCCGKKRVEITPRHMNRHEHTQLACTECGDVRYNVRRRIPETWGCGSARAAQTQLRTMFPDKHFNTVNYRGMKPRKHMNATTVAALRIYNIVVLRCTYVEWMTYWNHIRRRSIENAECSPIVQ